MASNEWTIILYLSFGFFVSQFLRSYYVKHDPQYGDENYNRQRHNYLMDEADKGKGRFEVGFSFFHNRKDTVSYKYGYITAVLLGLVTFCIMFSIFSLLPALEDISPKQFSREYLIWVILPLAAIFCLSDVFGPSLMKLILNGALIVLAGLMFYVSFPDLPRPFWAIAGFLLAFVSFLVTIGYRWITSWVKDRVGKYGIIAVYRHPTIFYGGTLMYIILAGIIGVLVIALK